MAKIRAKLETLKVAATSYTLKLPEYQEGDLLIAWLVRGSSSGTLTCDSGWSAFNEPYAFSEMGRGFYKTAGASESDPSFTSSVSQQLSAVIISVYGHDGIDSQVANTFEFTEILTTRALTINTPKCLVLQMLANTWSSSSEYPYASMNANTGHSLEVLTSTAANLLSVYSRYEKTAGAIAQESIWRINSSYKTSILAVAIKDSGAGHIPAYPDRTSDIEIIDYGRNHTSWNEFSNTWAQGGPFTPINGVNTANIYQTGTNGQGAMVTENPYQSCISFNLIPNTSTLSSMVLTLNSAKNFSSSLLVGRVNSNTRLGSATFGTIADMGLICAVGEGTNFRAFKVHAFDAEDSVFVGGNMFVIDPADSTVPFTNSGTPNVAAINKIQLSTRAATGALLTPLQTSTWYRVGKVIAAGGSAAVPTNFLEFAKDVCNAFVSPLAEITGNSAMVYAPMQIGGGDPCHISWNACLMQFPASSKTRPKAVRGHFSEGRLGISFNPIASDTVHITNAVFSSLTKFHFSILNTASASADWSLLGITLVNAIVTLRTVTTFDEFTFIDSDITQNGATVNNASLSGCYVTSDAPSELVGCSFISSGSGHAIEITTPGSYTLVNQQYSGYGANDTDDAVFYNNSGGTVTLSVSGGDTPTVKNGAGASTSVVAGATLTLSNLVSGSDVVIRDSGTETILASVDSNSGTTWNYSYTSLDTVDISIFKAGYVPAFINAYALSSSNVTLPVNQKIDRYYLE